MQQLRASGCFRPPSWRDAIDAPSICASGTDVLRDPDESPSIARVPDVAVAARRTKNFGSSFGAPTSRTVAACCILGLMAHPNEMEVTMSQKASGLLACGALAGPLFIDDGDKQRAGKRATG